MDGEGNVIVSDSHRKRKITPDDTVQYVTLGIFFLELHGCVVVIRNIVEGNFSHRVVVKIMGWSLVPPCAALFFLE